MRKGTDVIGKPVIVFDTGRVVDHVNDVIFDHEHNQLIGFLVDEGGWLSSARMIAFDQVQAIGSDAVIIASSDRIRRGEEIPVARQVLDRKQGALRGLKLMTTDGRDLGTMVDLFFDEETGRLDGYEVSGGLFSDAYSGRSFVPAPSAVRLGDQVAFVGPETAALMEEQAGGLRGAASRISEAVGDTARTAGGHMRTAADRAREGFQDTSIRVREAMASSSAAAGQQWSEWRDAATNRLISAEEQREFVVGRVAQHDVTSRAGATIVAAGSTITDADAALAEQHGELPLLYRAAGGSLVEAGRAAGERWSAAITVDSARGRRLRSTVMTRDLRVVGAAGHIATDDVIERARRYGREDELLAAVGLTPAGAASAGAHHAAGVTGDRVREGTAEVRDAVGTAWTRVRQAVGSMKDRALEQREESRIRGALGLPVTRVILDRDDRVILNTGELITHEAVERARGAGVLEALLDSAYRAHPEFSKEELRAPEAGEASLTTKQQHEDESLAAPGQRGREI